MARLENFSRLNSSQVEQNWIDPLSEQHAELFDLRTCTRLNPEKCPKCSHVRRGVRSVNSNPKASNDMQAMPLPNIPARFEIPIWNDVTDSRAALLRRLLAVQRRGKAYGSDALEWWAGRQAATEISRDKDEILTSRQSRNGSPKRWDKRGRNGELCKTSAERDSLRKGRNMLERRCLFVEWLGRMLPVKV